MPLLTLKTLYSLANRFEQKRSTKYRLDIFVLDRQIKHWRKFTGMCRKGKLLNVKQYMIFSAKVI